MDDVGAEQQGNTQAATKRRFLERPRLRDTDDVEHRTQLALPRQRHRVDLCKRLRIDGNRIAVGRRGRTARAVLHELADLLGQGHPRQQRVHLPLDLRRNQLRVRRGNDGGITRRRGARGTGQGERRTEQEHARGQTGTGSEAHAFSGEASPAEDDRMTPECKRLRQPR